MDAGLSVERLEAEGFIGRNNRGAKVWIGADGAPAAFTPGELLQIAAAGSAALTVEALVSGDTALVADVEPAQAPDLREYLRVRVTLSLDLSFLDDDRQDAAIDAAHRAVREWALVVRSLERGVPVELVVEPVTEQ